MTEPPGRRDNVHTSVDKLRGWVGLKARRGAPGRLSSYDDVSADLNRLWLGTSQGPGCRPECGCYVFCRVFYAVDVSLQ